MKFLIVLIAFVVNISVFAQEQKNDSNLNFSIISAGLTLSNDSSDKFINLGFLHNYYISKAVGICFSSSIDIGLQNKLSSGILNLSSCLFLSLIENKSLFIYAYLGSGISLGQLKVIDKVKVGINGLLGFSIGFDKIGIMISIKPNLYGNAHLDLVTYGLNYRF